MPGTDDDDYGAGGDAAAAAAAAARRGAAAVADATAAQAAKLVERSQKAAAASRLKREENRQREQQWALDKRFPTYTVDAAIQTAARSWKKPGELPLGTPIIHPHDGRWNDGLTEDDRDDLGVGDRGKALQRRVDANAAADLQYWKAAHDLAEKAAKVQRLTPTTAERLTVLNMLAYVKTMKRLVVTEATPSGTKDEYYCCFPSQTHEAMEALEVSKPTYAAAQPLPPPPPTLAPL